eukprot:3962124-Ditylum_brightwellii.AAC.1
MLWTTEKETLFIAEKSAWFGKEVPDILQVIDVSEGTINNVIEFSQDGVPDGVFFVTGTLQVEGPQRMGFKFTGAQYRSRRQES